MHGLDSHHVWHLIDNNLTIATSELVRPIDAATLPVGPVQIIAQQSETEQMRQIVGDDLAPIGTVHIGHLDFIGLRVAPIDLLALVVQGDAVWPKDILGNKQHALATVEIAALDLGPLLAPIGPEHPAMLGRDRDRSRLGQIFVYQHTPIFSI